MTRMDTEKLKSRSWSQMSQPASRSCQASCCENHVIHSAPEEPLILLGHEGAQAPQPDGGVEVVFSAISAR